MKILWIVNTPFAEVAKELNLPTSSSGTWFVSLLKAIRQIKEIELGVAFVAGKSFREVEVGGVTYFALPGNGKTMLLYHSSLKKYWKVVEEKFQPDVVHIFGTEYSHSLSYMRTFPNKKYLLTIQGVIGKIAPCRHEGITGFDLIRFRSLSEWIKGNGMIEQKILMKDNVKHEREIIQRSTAIIGRTDFDRFYTASINPNARYFSNFFSLSPEFYEASKWTLEGSDKKTIYGGSALSAPFKGGHILLQALALVKRTISDVRLKVICPSDAQGSIKARSEYGRYCRHIVDKYGLAENLICLPRLKSVQVAEEMKSSRLCVVPSAMENASATLREAMHLGLPCIASFRGGITELIRDRQSGFLYDYNDVEFLAGRILQIMNDEELSRKLSFNAMEAAKNWHNREKNTQEVIDVYYELGRNFKNAL